MPKAFTDCQTAGGKIRTVSLPHDEYAHICVQPGKKKGPRGGKTVMGEVKHKKA